MGSQVLRVLREGVWASLTGGCFLDPRLGPFANCVRLYAWLLLAGLPLALYTALPPSAGVGALYCALVGVFFAAVKTLNYRLHALLDRGGGTDPPAAGGAVGGHEDEDEEEEEGGDLEEGGAAALLRPRPPEHGERTPRPPGVGLELSLLRLPSATPPGRCGFNQLSELLPHLDEAAHDIWELGATNVIVTAADRARLRPPPPHGSPSKAQEEEGGVTGSSAPPPSGPETPPEGAQCPQPPPIFLFPPPATSPPNPPGGGGCGDPPKGLGLGFVEVHPSINQYGPV